MYKKLRLKDNARFSFSRLACKPDFMSLDDMLKNLNSSSSHVEVWFNDDIEYNKAINLIISDGLSSEQTKRLLDIYGMHNDYVRLYPALKHIIMTTNDEELFCKAGDIIALIEIIICDNWQLQKWLHNEIYQMFWSRIENIENIVKSADQPIMEYSLSQILTLPSLERLNISLCDHLRELSTQKEVPTIPISAGFYILNITHKHLSIQDRFEYLFCSFPVVSPLYFNNHLNTIEEARVYLDLILDEGSLFFRTPHMIMDTLRQLLNQRRPIEIELYMLQRLVDEFGTVCERAGIDNHDKATSPMEIACRTATQYSEPLKEFGRKCWDLYQGDNADRYKTVDGLLQMASRNVNHILDQKRFLVKNLRKRTEEVAKNLEERSK